MKLRQHIFSFVVAAASFAAPVASADPLRMELVPEAAKMLGKGSLWRGVPKRDVAVTIYATALAMSCTDQYDPEWFKLPNGAPMQMKRFTQYGEPKIALARRDEDSGHAVFDDYPASVKAPVCARLIALAQAAEAKKVADAARVQRLQQARAARAAKHVRRATLMRHAHP